MDRTILHVDINNCYASIECLYRPELRNQPMAVGGNEELRHGVVLAKNEYAKKFGIVTGESLWHARQKCPELKIVAPNHQLYAEYSNRLRALLAEYSDQVEPFGLDEAWVDVSESVPLFGAGIKMADQIRRRVREELGVTCSVGVSFNKVFAKMGSDLKKPDATSQISRENYQQIIWPMPVRSMLYIGRNTEQKLRQLLNIKTIGALARADEALLTRHFGKMGVMFWLFANGKDDAPVRSIIDEHTSKSIGNSFTTPRDLENDADVHNLMAHLADSVAARLREQDLKAGVVQIYIRDQNFSSVQRQGVLASPTFLSKDLLARGMELFHACYDWQTCLPIRMLGLRCTNLTSPQEESIQLSLFNDEKNDKQEQLSFVIDRLRQKFGDQCIMTGTEQISSDIYHS